MKEIELRDDGELMDDVLGHYRVIKEGLDDIVVIKNMPIKQIKQKHISIMGQDDIDYVVETCVIRDKYIVKPLDTLKDVALKFKTTPEKIIKNNNLSSDRLFIGQMLEI